MSFEVILPFLRPIEHLIRDGEISEIMVNGSGESTLRSTANCCRSPMPQFQRSHCRLQCEISPAHWGMRSMMRCHCWMHACRTVHELPQRSRRARAGGRP